MSENNHVSYPVLILACVASIVTTVLMLDKSGKLLHNDDKDALALSHYKVVYMDAQAQANYRLSPKPSMQTAICHSGYLFIYADQNPDLHGLLVDYKNRGVKCAPEMEQPAADAP